MEDQGAYLGDIAKNNLDEAVWQWLEAIAETVRIEKTASALNLAFALVPRKTGVQELRGLPASGKSFVPEPGAIRIGGWTIDRLCRVWLLMQVDRTDKAVYLAKTGALFSGASMNELVALYSALPVLAYPEAWKLRCAEGIRTNIGTVLEAILYENVYPFYFLDEAAYNQMVLKAFFTDKDIDRIAGIDERANPPLAAVLSDYAHERWAAGRTVNPQLWRLTAKYIDAGNFADIRRLWDTGTAIEKRAALLACSQSNFEPARQLWENASAIKKEIGERKISWHNLAEDRSFK
jgi:hypothetical protein